ncbi:HTH_Tnp_Tc3_2 domain-containing protein [Trichonephila clavipes]|nr:HTH_Tnp_Tc3_2 domain-containing protein [Trichonephila clavipes]
MSYHQCLDDGMRWRMVGSHKNPLSKVTVSKRLYGGGLFARKPAVCVPLTSTNRRAYLAWSRQHKDWSMDQWATVLLTNESCFSLNTYSRRTRSYGGDQGPVTYPSMSTKSTIVVDNV